MKMLAARDGSYFRRRLQKLSTSALIWRVAGMSPNRSRKLGREVKIAALKAVS
jgi:hypothetical protein